MRWRFCLISLALYFFTVVFARLEKVVAIHSQAFKVPLSITFMMLSSAQLLGFPTNHKRKAAERLHPNSFARLHALAEPTASVIPGVLTII